MAAAITGISTGTTGWVFTVTADGPYDVYVRGEIFARASEAATFTINDGAESGCPDVVVYDTGAEPPLGCPYVALQWRRVKGVDSYVIHEIIGSTAIVRGTMTARDTDSYPTWKSGILEDGSTHTYSVSAVKSGVQSPVLSTTTTIIRNPRPVNAAATLATAEGVTTLTYDYAVNNGV